MTDDDLRAALLVLLVHQAQDSIALAEVLPSDITWLGGANREMSITRMQDAVQRMRRTGDEARSLLAVLKEDR